MEIIASVQMSNINSTVGNKKSITEEYTAENIIDILKTDQKNVITEIIFKYNFNEVYDYFLDSLTCISELDYVFKNTNKFVMYKNLLSYFPLKIDQYKKLQIKNIFILLCELVSINKGQYLLSKIPLKELFEILTPEYRNELYFISGVSGTLPTFLAIDKLVEKKNYIDNYYKSILSAACRNADDRLLKYIIKNLDSYHFPTNNNQMFIRCLLTHTFSPHIPVKYTLRRLKLINTKINLKPFFPDMVKCITSVELFGKVYKYYNDGKSLLLDYNLSLSNIISYSENENYMEVINQVVNILENNDDKYMFLVQSYIDFFDKGSQYVNVSKYYREEFKQNEKVILLHTRFINFIISSHLPSSVNIYNKNFIKNFNSILTNTNPLYYLKSIYNYQSKLNGFIFLLPFVPYFPTEHDRQFMDRHFLIKLNCIRHNIKLWLRKRNKIVKIAKRIEEYCISQKVINKTPFTKLPPRHCLPYELDSLNETSDGYYLISEKADGCLVDFVSNTVEPIIPEYTSTNIKAEFIEDLDLYLIFDYNINDTILNRYDSLRKAHTMTKDCPSIRDNIIYDFDQLTVAIKEERSRFKEFLKLPYKNYRIYPKSSWLVKDPRKLNKELIDNIIEEHDHDFICNQGEYENDGLVITPLDGSREIKIKPKSLHTLDILYNNGWKDREGNSWNHIIKTSNTYRNNMIMRCYPIFEKNNGNWMFEPREFRYDKTKPNTNKIIKIIYALHSINWEKLNIEKDVYYQSTKNVKSESWKKVINLQTNHLKNIIELANINIKSTWLDLGCGSGKVLRTLHDYMIKMYVGIDLDMKQLLNGIKRTDSNRFQSSNSRFIHCNLKNDWNTSKISIDYLDDRDKFDNVICNFSLAHFYDNTFFEKLNKVTNDNSIFIFNIVNNNILNRWESGEDYMYLDGNEVKYFFSSVHNKEMTEKYITEDDIKTSLTNYGWEISHKTTPCGQNIDSKYTWYILKKI